ncbi:hypothetical protein COL60_16455 [Bacillus pseudomycoides]|uniref:hypothetical protein n=1 Tax=Bacillus pseudomycoides TaxID=64104 RepID=UPI000BF4960F|nr:hypothetical protein [Bacillus pseudomycoides]PFZ08417.1 hypothetical protein COL60_16455 [Bacillus pseudomycoides]PFZ09777.1 hypothetical protein COL63_21125 [Bacillus pseudomycoides]
MKYKDLPTEDDYLLAEKRGLSRKNVYQRVVTYGWDIEEAISKPVGGRGPGRHRGMAKVAEENGVSQHVFYYRRRKGMPLYDAATKPVKKYKNHDESFKKLALENGIALSTYKRRVANGWNLEEAATKPARNYVRTKEPETWDDMYVHWLKVAKNNGIPRSNYYQRVKKGWGFEKAATTPLKHNTESTFTKEQLRIAEQHGIGFKTLYQRVVYLNWDLDKAMTTAPLKPQQRGKKNIS